MSYVRQLELPLELGTVLPLMNEHGSEVFGAETLIDVRTYVALADRGFLRVYGLFDEVGDVLIGYSIFMVSVDTFKARILKADLVAIYVKPEKRGHGTWEMVEVAEKKLAEEGVNEICAHTNNVDALQAFFSRHGYKETDVVLSKRID